MPCRLVALRLWIECTNVRPDTGHAKLGVGPLAASAPEVSHAKVIGASRFRLFISTPINKKGKILYHLEEFEKHTDLKAKYGVNAYMLWVLGLYLDEPDLDALAARSLTDGSNDKCMDFVEVDKTGQKIVIAQGFFSRKKTDKAPSKNASDLTIAASWIANGDKKAKTINERARVRAEDCRSALQAEEVAGIELLYIHNLPESINTQEEIETCERTVNKLFSEYELPVICREFGLKEVEALYSERSSQILINEKVRIEGVKLGSHKSKDWDAHVYTVTGSWLRNLFKQYDERLFSANYRGFLGITRRKTINSAIRNTAMSQPSDFWVFNNGITLLTRALKGRRGASTLDGISIINGAQTTGSLGNVDSLVDLSSVQVMCRIVVCKNPEKIDDIVKFNNTQNRITTWDQYANDETQKLIQSQFQDLGYNYSVKRGFEASDSEIGIEKVAPSALAFNGFYIDANRGKNAIFDRPEIYKRAFADRTARHLLLAYVLSRSVDEVKRSLQEKNGKTESEDKQLALFNYLSFKPFLLACIGVTLQQFIGGKLQPASASLTNYGIKETVGKTAAQFDKIARQVLRAVSRALDNKERLGGEPVARILKDDSSLSDIRGDINSYIESILDGQLDAEHLKLIGVNN